jgi:hypothetical protein
MNLGLAKNHMVHALNLNPLSTPNGSLHFEASRGRHYNGNHLAHNYGILPEKNLDASFHNPGPHSTRVVSHDSRVCRPDFPHKILQDNLCNPSNTELKLGQSSYHQPMTTLFPLGQSTVIDFQKSQSHRPLVNQSEFASYIVLLSYLLCALSFKDRTLEVDYDNYLCSISSFMYA